MSCVDFGYGPGGTLNDPAEIGARRWGQQGGHFNGCHYRAFLQFVAPSFLSFWPGQTVAWPNFEWGIDITTVHVIDCDVPSCGEDVLDNNHGGWDHEEGEISVKKIVPLITLPKHSSRSQAGKQSKPEEPPVHRRPDSPGHCRTGLCLEDKMETGVI
ncbi:hypothetical protein BaRGS_00008784 [Batillaria attramentaria]|uniref:Uncharacterized protein n=1 Tax=Batillaria attramentaria TaxID=370345 RepID=A0ABD0LL18_9CAEN